MADQENESNIYGSEFVDAVIDNGSAGPSRTIRFETGRLAQQAAGSVTIYLGDTMVLSAATASKRPKDNLDFFPLTVDVEERMYAAGRIPGSFFRREGRPSEDAILTCRLTDRPLRPSFKKGLRNEVQIVSTVLSLDPTHLYDVLAINSAACSVLLSGLPFTGPVGATRVACVAGQWIAFPTTEELEGATFDMVVAGRMLDDGDVAIMMVEAEATREAVEIIAGGGKMPTEDVVAEGLEAAKPAIAAVCKAQLELQGELAQGAARLPRLPRLRGRRAGRRHGGRRGRPHRRDEHRRQAGARGRHRRRQGQGAGGARRALRGPREGGQRRVPQPDQDRRAPPHRLRTRSASTAVASRTSASCRPRSRSCRGCTARRCSSAARPRSWASPR